MARTERSIRTVLVWALALAGLPASTRSQRSPFTLTVAPERPLIEHRWAGQYLNFDFLIANSGPPAVLDRIELSVFDRADRFVIRKYLGRHGESPGIETIPDRALPRAGLLGIFNPFVAFDSLVDLSRLRYAFTFLRGGSPTEVTVEVRPEDYRPKTVLGFPLRGRVIVYDGHDFYSHHRRVNLAHPGVRRMKLADNPVRYASDFCVVDSANRLHRGDPSRVEEWFSYGAPVVATAAGVVVSATGAMPENRIVGGRLVYPTHLPAGLPARARDLGNHVIIDHGNGELSLFAHLKPESVTVRAGDRVSAGQPIGRIGFSGDTGLHVHLHYGLVTGPEFASAHALPAYFTNFRRLLGSGATAVALGSVDSGDLIEATP